MQAQNSPSNNIAGKIESSTSSSNGLLTVNNEDSKMIKQPPFILNQDECIEIKISDQNSEALRIALEFLYTDRIISLEGHGIKNLSFPILNNQH